jgi:hypothetical protein
MENPGGSLIPFNDTSSLGLLQEASKATAKNPIDKFILLMRKLFNRHKYLVDRSTMHRFLHEYGEIFDDRPF